MKKYLHRVLGLYETRAAADVARDRLIRRGLPASQLKMLQPARDGATPEARPDSDDVLHEMLRDAALGALVGSAIGVAGMAVMVIAKTGLFSVDLVLGTLIMIGWGGTTGAFVGAAAGARSRRGGVADLLRISLANGYVVLVAHADTEEQTTMAQLVLGESIRNPNGA